MRTASCRHCGGILEPHATYCSDCGARVRPSQPLTPGRVIRAALLALLAVPSIVAAVWCVMAGAACPLSGSDGSRLYLAIAGWLAVAGSLAAVACGLVLLAAQELSARSPRPRRWAERRRAGSRGPEDDHG